MDERIRALEKNISIIDYHNFDLWVGEAYKSFRIFSEEFLVMTANIN